jgi:tetratricopeptide (TPR) repeat protein
MAGEDDDRGPFDVEEPDFESEAIQQLARRFMAALADKDAGNVDRAEDELRAIVSEEPRLAEPRMELARLLLDTDRIAPAEEQAREALEQLEKTGVWTEEVPENVVRALAHALLAEILRRHADEDDVIFGDPAAFKAIVDESRKHFEAAAALDPADEYASYHAFFLGVDGKGDRQPVGDDDDSDA